MKKIDIIYFILFIFIGACLIYIYEKKPEKKYVYDNQKKEEKLIVQKTNFNQKNGKIDINKALENEFYSRKISKKITSNIIKYREKIGHIENINDLKLIKGIGDVTLNKINSYFYVDENIKNKNLKKININEADEELLKWLKFEPKEIKKIKDWKLQKGVIFSNIELLEILGSIRYEVFSDRIKYMN